MEKSRTLLLLILISSLFITKASGQDSWLFTLEPEVRPRLEIRDGYQKLASEGNVPAIFISQRTRLGFVLETSKIKIKLTPQDVRVWGDEQYGSTAGIFGNDASLDMFEGYAEISFLDDHKISIGRQTLLYDNLWLLSDKNWNQSAIASDAVVLKLNYDRLKLHLATSWNSYGESHSNNYYFANRYKTLNYLWLNRSFDNSKLSFLHITTGQTEKDSANKLNFKHTSGLYYSKNTDKMTINANAYYQYGKNSTAQDVSAYMLYFSLMYKINNFEVGPEFTLFSGNEVVGAGQTVDRNFDLIYTAVHKFLGQMDYFTNIKPHTKQGGLIHAALNVNYRFSKNLSIQNSTHLFSLAQTNAYTPTDKNLGVENDLIVRYKLNQWANIEGGYMFFVPTKSLELIQNIPNSKFSNFAYLKLIVKPDKVKLFN